MNISVVVPFRNVEPYIERCICSLLAQRFHKGSFEIILVDNNSTDGSAEVVRRYPQIRLLSESRVGAYAARNLGVAEARGEIIAFTDSDCSTEPDWLESISEAFASPEVILVQGCRRPAGKSLGLSLLSDYESAKAAYIYSAGTREILYGYTNNMAVRRSAFDRVGPFLEIERGADTLFIRRVLEEYSNKAIRYSPVMIVQHLEISSIWKSFQKQAVYGRSYQSNKRIVAWRPLNGLERMQILSRAIRRGRYSTMESLVLMLLLSVGVLYFILGQWHPVRNGRGGIKSALKPSALTQLPDRERLGARTPRAENDQTEKNTA